MKYIKTYEENKKYPKYNVGDYVLLSIKKIDKNNIKYGNDDPISIPDDSLAQIVGIDFNVDYPYTSKFYNNREFDLKPNEIIRLLTPEEIEEFEMKKEANKYNL